MLVLKCVLETDSGHKSGEIARRNGLWDAFSAGKDTLLGIGLNFGFWREAVTSSFPI
jgi:hypothetical protein